MGFYTGRLVRTGNAMGGSTPPGVPPGINADGHFSDNNAEKLSVTINVRSPRGFELIQKLVAVSDVVIENFSSGVLKSWDLGYDDMVKLKSDIIYVSMAGFGHTGRFNHYTTMGPSVQALSDLTFLSGLPDHPSAGWGWSYMDDTGGMYGTISVLTALHHRNVTGEGQHVDLSQVAAAITLTGPAMLDLTVNARGSRREGYPPGNRTHWPGTPLLNNYRGPTTAPHNSYRTKGLGYNDWCVIACFSDEEWQRLVKVMSSPAWANDDRFATLSGRIEHQEELDRNIEAWTVTLEKYELTERCQAAGVGAMPVQSTEDRVEHDPQLRSQDMYAPVPHSVLGTFPLQNAPFTFSETPAPVQRAGPLAGEHNIQILCEMLGVSREELKAGYENATFWPPSVPVESYLLEALEETTVRA